MRKERKNQLIQSLNHQKLTQIKVSQIKKIRNNRELKSHNSLMVKYQRLI